MSKRCKHFPECSVICTIFGRFWRKYFDLNRCKMHSRFKLPPLCTARQFWVQDVSLLILRVEIQLRKCVKNPHILDFRISEILRNSEKWTRKSLNINWRFSHRNSVYFPDARRPHGRAVDDRQGNFAGTFGLHGDLCDLVRRSEPKQFVNFCTPWTKILFTVRFLFFVFLAFHCFHHYLKPRLPAAKPASPSCSLRS